MMQSRNIRSAPLAERPLADTLDMKSTPRNNRKGASPPRTPSSTSHRPSKNKGAIRGLNIRPSARETFLEDITPVDNVKSSTATHRYGRDSHDLSLSPRHITRDSVVDNMLLSLDQISIRGGSRDQAQLYSAFNDDETARTATGSKSGKSEFERVHTYSSSYGSEDELTEDDPLNRRFNQLLRGRRSNSSSNFQSGLGRIDSVGAETNKAKGNVLDTQRSAAAGERYQAFHSHGGKKGSKSSGSSVDFGHSQIPAATRWIPPVKQRSSSFDQGYTERAAASSRLDRVSDKLKSNGGAESALYDSYDAAPTPTVPIGPRRYHAPPPASYLQHADHASLVTPKLSRKSSNGSSKNNHNCKGDSETLGATSMGTQLDESGDVSNHRELPRLPYADNPPAPSPIISYRKPSVPSSQDNVTSVKERPGFFRRVFGSSKSSTSIQRDIPVQQLVRAGTPLSIFSNDRARPQGGPQQLGSQVIDLSKPLPKEPLGEAKDSGVPLNKKTSSFFRRRKKSVSGFNAPPTPPVLLRPPRNVIATDIQQSPVSSLRKVMNPYIKSPIESPQDFYDTREDFDPINEGDQREKASLLDLDTPKVKTNEDVGFGAHDRSESVSSARMQDFGSLRNPKARTNTSSRNEARDTKYDSFLQDSSGNEGPSTPKVKNLEEKRRQQLSSTTPSAIKDTSIMPVADDYEKHGHATKSSNENVATLPRSSARNAKLSKRLLSATNTSGSGDETQVGAKILPVANNTSASTGMPPRSKRLWLKPTPSEEQLSGAGRIRKGNGLILPLEGANESARASASSSSDYKSASSLPIVSIDDEETVKPIPQIFEPDKLPPSFDLEPTTEDRERAKKIYDGEEEFVTRTRAAAWLGEATPVSTRSRRAYMELFNYTNLNILAALRTLCEKLVLKAETQQVDRLLDAFSTRWCECNPNHGFKATDVVHTICYSLLLLNTDLHLADIEQKMTRIQFVKNTIPTIRRVAADAAPDDYETIRASTFHPRAPIPWMEPESPTATSPTAATFPQEVRDGRISPEMVRPTYRLSMRPSQRSDRDQSNPSPTPLDFDSPIDDCGPLVKAPFHGSSRTWEVQLEIVLKDFFNSIRQQKLPLYGAPTGRPQDQLAPSSSLSVLTGNMLRRTPSTLSKAPSETLSYRGRPADHRFGTGRWSSKTRSRPRLYPHSAVGSSRTSLDDQSSVWSPSVSSTWSKYSFGKTQTSMSVESFGSNFPQGDYKQSIGFANALSQAIIREEAAGTNPDEPIKVAPLLEDETLGLAGAPWAKEGILQHKHHLDSVDKKAKDRNWNECFAVVEKGWMKLFSFNMNKSMRSRAKLRQASGGVVGGGNWSENAEALGSFLLRQTIASALPPPGYSKTRPHVWALSLPTGAVHLFQVGTPEIVKEFVSTANYWSARLSKEPLVGGISNIEFGWSDSIINIALTNLENIPPPGSAAGQGPRPSLQSSIRSSMDQGHVKPKLPGDRIVISDWNPPQQSMMASALLEVDQFKALSTYVKNVEEDLQKHNELRAPMQIAVSLESKIALFYSKCGMKITLIQFSPRHPNSIKAMSNWERKSSYLLREIVKFRTYIDSLTAAQLQKEKIYAGRQQAVGGKENEAHSEKI
ncbi:MAG: hypothetical protein M1827_000185 [Pycnora praestabilis]|nr:MAG: hypothetical protein M1827_000185 [Pycnora praestabilis]